MTSPRAVARERRREEGIRFARRMYLPRTIGLALGAVCVAGGLWQSQLASLPLLLGYPSLVGIGVYWLSRRVRQQNQMLSALSTTRRRLIPHRFRT